MVHEMSKSMSKIIETSAASNYFKNKCNALPIEKRVIVRAKHKHRLMMRAGGFSTLLVVMIGKV